MEAIAKPHLLALWHHAIDHARHLKERSLASILGVLLTLEQIHGTGQQKGAITEVWTPLLLALVPQLQKALQKTVPMPTSSGASGDMPVLQGNYIKPKGETILAASKMDQDKWMDLLTSSGIMSVLAHQRTKAAQKKNQPTAEATGGESLSVSEKHGGPWLPIDDINKKELIDLATKAGIISPSKPTRK